MRLQPNAPPINYVAWKFQRDRSHTWSRSHFPSYLRGAESKGLLQRGDGADYDGGAGGAASVNQGYQQSVGLDIEKAVMRRRRSRGSGVGNERQGFLAITTRGNAILNVFWRHFGSRHVTQPVQEIETKAISRFNHLQFGSQNLVNESHKRRNRLSQSPLEAQRNN